MIQFLKKGGIDTSDANAVANNILLNKTAYANGTKLVGTMPNNGTLNYMPSANQQTIPAGYTDGGTVEAVTSAIDVNIIPTNIKSGIEILRSNGYFNRRSYDTREI